MSAHEDEFPLGPLESDAAGQAPPSKALIKHMVKRFLSWRLPDDFSPDAGISFTPEFNVEWNAQHGRPPQRHEPVGTNLLSADQAEAMIRHMMEGRPMPAPLVESTARSGPLADAIREIATSSDLAKSTSAWIDGSIAQPGVSDDLGLSNLGALSIEAAAEPTPAPTDQPNADKRRWRILDRESCWHEIYGDRLTREEDWIIIRAGGEQAAIFHRPASVIER